MRSIALASCIYLLVVLHKLEASTLKLCKHSNDSATDKVSKLLSKRLSIGLVLAHSRVAKRTLRYNVD